MSTPLKRTILERVLINPMRAFRCGALTNPVASQKSHGLALPHLQRDISQDLTGTIKGIQAIHLKEALHDESWPR